MSQWYGLEPLSACDRPGIEFRSPKPKLLLLGQEPSPRSTSKPHANNAFVANSVWEKRAESKSLWRMRAWKVGSGREGDEKRKEGKGFFRCLATAKVVVEMVAFGKKGRSVWKSKHHKKEMGDFFHFLPSSLGGRWRWQESKEEGGGFWKGMEV